MALVATPRAVILDMDGLMLDTESIYKHAWQNAAIECGYDLNDDFYLTLVGQPNPACEAALLDRFGDRFPLDDFRVRWESLWRGTVETPGISTETRSERPAVVPKREGASAGNRNIERP